MSSSLATHWLCDLGQGTTSLFLSFQLRIVRDWISKVPSSPAAPAAGSVLVPLRTWPTGGPGPRLRAVRLTWAWRQRTSKCNSLWETKAGGRDRVAG